MGLFSIDADGVRARLAKSLRRVVDGRGVRNAALHVDAPRIGLNEGWATGIADARDGAPMTADVPFITASVGKIAMAATAFALADEGLVDLDAPISKWVARDVLAGLPVGGTTAAAHGVTPRRLMANRAGLPDYYDSDQHSARDGAPNVARLLVEEPDRSWTRDQLLAYAGDHYDGFAAPGEAFLYSDLGWDLLGLVFEGATGAAFHEVVRARVLDPLGLERTWYHAFEPAPAGLAPIADVFVGDVNLARAPCLSVDQAGGGLASTASDLARLVRGLADGSLDRLATDWTPDAMRRGLDYGYGTWRWRPGRIFFALFQLPVLRGVSGSNNSFAYVTDAGDVLAGTLNQADDPSRHVKFALSQVVPVLHRAR